MSTDGGHGSSISDSFADEDGVPLSPGGSLHSGTGASHISTGTLDGPTDFSSLHETASALPSNIEIHPQNGVLSGASPSQQFIKRPLNAYMIWTRQERQKIVANDPKIKMNEVSKAMGERWKAMSDKEKRPYFEMAKKYAIEHKKALKDNPNLTYIPPKKKAAKEHGHDPNGPKSPLSVHSPSPSTPVTPGHGAMQVAQALGVRTPNAVSSGGVTAFRVPATPTTQTRFQPITSVNGQQMVGTTTIRTVDDRTPIGTRVIAAPPPPRLTAAQALEFYYQSLCQPAFPLLVESPSNPLGMSMTPHQYYEQWQQALVPQAQPQPPSATGAHH